MNWLKKRSGAILALLALGGIGLLSFSYGKKLDYKADQVAVQPTKPKASEIVETVSGQTNVQTPAQTNNSAQPTATEMAAAAPSEVEAPQPATSDQTQTASTAPEAESAEAPEPANASLAAAIDTAKTAEPDTNATVLALSPTVETPEGVTAPQFDVVRIDPNGGALFAGRAEPNSQIEIVSNGQIIGTATTSSNGEFVALFTTELPKQPQAIEILATDTQGRTAKSLDPIIVLGTLDTSDKSLELAALSDTPEREPESLLSPAILQTRDDDVKLLQPSTQLLVDHVVIDTITYGDQAGVVLQGRGQPGSEIRVYADSAFQGVAEIGGDGGWTMSVDALDEGIYTLRVDQVGPKGRVASRFETPFKREKPQAVTLARLKSEAEIVVQPGNNLWTIAQNRYGEGFKYTVIFDANKDQITNPDLIYPGQVFDLPN